MNHTETDTIILKNTLKSNGMKTEAQLKVIPEGGEMTAEADSIRVSHADSVTLIFACGTDYKMELPAFRGEDPHEAISQRIRQAAARGYSSLKSDHVKDHSELFSRMELGFNEDIPQIPTDAVSYTHLNNRLSNNMDTDYYTKLSLDMSSPFFNKATQQTTAPGSTLKLLSAVTGMRCV